MKYIGAYLTRTACVPAQNGCRAFREGGRLCCKALSEGPAAACQMEDKMSVKKAGEASHQCVSSRSSVNEEQALV